MPYQKVTLTNGSEEGWHTVQRVYFALQSLVQTNPAALNELYQVCLNPRYPRSYTDTLVTFHLSRHDGVVEHNVKNITLCSVEVKGLTIQFKSPVQKGPYVV